MHGSMEAWKYGSVNYGCVDVVAINAWKHGSMKA